MAVEEVTLRFHAMVRMMSVVHRRVVSGDVSPNVCRRGTIRMSAKDLRMIECDANTSLLLSVVKFSRETVIHVYSSLVNRSGILI